MSKVNISNKKYVVYIHRDSNNIPFYVGYGAPLRPYSTCDRLQYWKEASKDGYSIEVVLESDDINEARELETFLIDTLGRKDLHRGTLLNKANGTLGMHPDYLPKRYSRGERKSKSVNQLDKNNNIIATWSKAKLAADALGFADSSIRGACNGGYSYKGFYWEFSSDK